MVMLEEKSKMSATYSLFRHPRRTDTNASVHTLWGQTPPSFQDGIPRIPYPNIPHLAPGTFPLALVSVMMQPFSDPYTNGNLDVILWRNVNSTLIM
jgi:hypothetical protein